MNNLGVVAVMLVVEFLDVSASTVSKVAMKGGMNDFVFVMYSNVFAALFLLLFCFFLYRKRNLPPLTPWIFAQLCVNGFISFSLQMFKFLGIGYSSPTLASAMSDLVPAFTFILAIICRMERLELGAGSSQVKIFGTLVTFMGALTITLYKGLPLINDHGHWKSFISEELRSSQFNWVIGASFLAAWSLFLSLMFILQTKIIKEYPSEPMVILARSIVVVILSAPVSLISGKDLKAFRLGLNMELVAILSYAFFSLGFQSLVHIWGSIRSSTNGNTKLCQSFNNLRLKDPKPLV
ncbi:hypothetical protein L6164_027222 [Bauhinia variegata]|uniref:Uncharacterized protein n=1 Tax=Bauhinia variegata TaxID=167791 RepID=A0ACB9LU09_BAUVA|nr:hypothetical protein L6164_027222 [Bauhinia variegata]